MSASRRNKIATWAGVTSLVLATLSIWLIWVGNEAAFLESLPPDSAIVPKDPIIDRAVALMSSIASIVGVIVAAIVSVAGFYMESTKARAEVAKLDVEIELLKVQLKKAMEGTS